MTLHTVTYNDDVTSAKLNDLAHGDVIARFDAEGNAQYMRAVLRTEDGSVTLGFPKRMVRDENASFVDYVDEGKGATAKYAIVGKVTMRSAKPTTAKAKSAGTSKAKHQPKAADSLDDAHDKRIAQRRSTKSTGKVVKSPAELSAKLVEHKATTTAKPLTKAAAADVITTLADAIDAQVTALRAVAAAL